MRLIRTDIDVYKRQVYTLVPLDNRAMAIGAGNQNGIAVTYSLDASSKPSTKTYAWGNNAY